MKIKAIRQRVAHAYDMKNKTYNTEVAFCIYADSHYILDTEEDNVIEVCRTEEEAIEVCNYKELKGDVYYKPVLIDAHSGNRVTRSTFHLYEDCP